MTSHTALSGQSSGQGSQPRVVVTTPLVPPGVPLARQIEVRVEGDEPGAASGAATAPAASSLLRPCRLNFRDGCYALFYQPTGSAVSYEGTLRVDRAAPDGGPDGIIVSGDLYTRPKVRVPPIHPTPVGAHGDASDGAVATEQSHFRCNIGKPAMAVIMVKEIRTIIGDKEI